MIVPRETPLAPGARSNLDTYAVRPIFFPRDLREALADDIKKTFRVPVTQENSLVHPGAWVGVDLESGRARRKPSPELRVRCRFPSGSVRAVTVSPLFQTGDLFYVRAGGRQKRADSTLTLEVLGVDVGRLQDMSDQDAIGEGVAFKRTITPEMTVGPRNWFAAHWEDEYGRLSWRANPWVWITRVRVYHANVNAMLAGWERKP